MDLNEVQRLFNRALDYTFSRRKLVMVSVVLSLCGLLAIFFRALAFYAGEWVLMSLTFLPIFVCGGILLAMGVVLTRIYHDEIKKRPVSYSRVLSKSWEIVIGASYFFVPIILCYLLMWVLLGIFFLLRQTPTAGDFFAVILAFGPFLLNLGSLLLGFLSLCLLFFVTPTVALKSVDPISVSHVIVNRLRDDVFTNGLMMLIALLPLTVVLGFLIFAAVLTGTTYVGADEALEIILQWFFIMIPFTILLSPVVIFFFNFAAEAHVFLRKRREDSAPARSRS